MVKISGFGMCIVMDVSLQNRHFKLDDSALNYCTRICGIFGHANKGGAISEFERPLETGFE